MSALVLLSRAHTASSGASNSLDPSNDMNNNATRSHRSANIFDIKLPQYENHISSDDAFHIRAVSERAHYGDMSRTEQAVENGKINPSVHDNLTASEAAARHVAEIRFAINQELGQVARET